ncbi:hypothetical protein [Kibdelosporangium persicum]|uniref:hypothetical protein n=1 Tax=Kibdelosporangium persicum TaxID=2698649 RepID=UPI0015632D5D|nr:hypothetical protein [Kibdelosporangium persicum]
MPPPDKNSWALTHNDMPAWYNLVHTWTHQNALIVATDGQVASYDRGTGARQWITEPPGDAPDAPLFCGASPTISGKKIALAYGSARKTDTSTARTRLCSMQAPAS